jgi:hypothetical protein
VEGLEAGRKLAQETVAASDKGGEHALLVRYDVASGALLRYVASVPDGDRRAAEAYYWLGVIESRVGRSFWLSQTEPYLEAAIRLAPGDPLAGKAYALLEEFVVGSYTGSSGQHVPPDVKTWLAELARLAPQRSHGARYTSRPSSVLHARLEISCAGISDRFFSSTTMSARLPTQSGHLALAERHTPPIGRRRAASEVCTASGITPARAATPGRAAERPRSPRADSSM